MSTAMIALASVTKRYGKGPEVLRDVSLEVASGETLALVGPSGCGKTTTLKLINRLVRPSSGRVLVGGVDVGTRDGAELRRGIGYVVQEGGLFPHLSAAANVDVVPRLLGWDEAHRAARRRELFELLGLDEALASRFPLQLSGGQRQRVGLARALAADPDVLLMDEPFGALDPVIRARLQREFGALQRRLHKTVVLVTHDMQEALALADQVAVLRQGRVEQLATPAELREAPATDFVREMLGDEVDEPLADGAKHGDAKGDDAPAADAPADDAPADDVEVER